jgi:hypothetical protein
MPQMWLRPYIAAGRMGIGAAVVKGIPSHADRAPKARIMMVFL